MKKKVIGVRNERFGRSIRSTTNEMKRRKITYPRTKKTPSQSSIYRVIKEGVEIKIKRRPQLSDLNKQERLEYAKNELNKSFKERYSHTCFVDESYISLEHLGKGSLIEHPATPKLTQNELVRNIKSKTFYPKIFVMACITAPVILNEDVMDDNGNKEEARFSNNGKISLIRIDELDELDEYDLSISKNFCFGIVWCLFCMMFLFEYIN